MDLWNKALILTKALDQCVGTNYISKGEKESVCNILSRLGTVDNDLLYTQSHDTKKMIKCSYEHEIKTSQA